MQRSLLILVGALFGCLALAACSASPTSEAALDVGPPVATVATYSELFTEYFAPGTAGHCATAGCHADPGHNEWLCGTTKDSCYKGMIQVGLLDPAHPERSMIVDPSLSPLVWLNPSGGNMPLDAQLPNSAARAAISAWVADGAKND